MNIPNITPLAQAREMTAQELAMLPIDHLQVLLDEAAAMKAQATAIADRLNTACDIRFSARADELRKAEGKDTGRVSIDEGDFIVRADRPKRVTWDQSKLHSAVQVIREQWGEKASDYVTMEIKVSETKFNAWPPMIAGLFEPARTVGAGKATYAIERRAA